MKFKATVRDSRSFVRVCRACLTIGKEWVIKLHPTKMRFIAHVKVTDGIQAWASCDTNAIFDVCHVQSSRNDNAIFCVIADIAQLHHHMRRAEEYASVQIKLAWMPGRRPALRILMQNESAERLSSHDVPLRVLGAEDIQSISAPLLEGELMQVVLPKLSDLTFFVENVRSASCDLVTFTAQSSKAEGGARASCNLIIAAECMHATYALQYAAARLKDDEDNEEDEEEESPNSDGRPIATTVTVETKRLTWLLAKREITPQEAVLYLVDGKSVVLRLSTSDGISLIAYIPAVLR